MKERLAFLGLGTMGTPMVRNLLKAGYPVTVYNRTASKAESLRGSGAEVAATPGSAARSADVVLSCLLDAVAVEAVMSGPEGVVEAVRPGQVFIDFTTNSPPYSIRLAETLAARGCAMLDAPVSGGDVGAIEGTLSIMAGGAPEVFERCGPILQALGRRIVLMGEAVGAGGFAKLANQIMVGVHLAVMGEAMVFGAKAGLNLDRLAEALAGGMAQSAAMDLKIEKVLTGRFTPGAEVNVHLKDLTYVGEAMEALGIRLPLSELARDLYRQTVEAGFGAEDHSAVTRVLEKMAGVEARR